VTKVIKSNSRQYEILDTIYKTIEEKGFPPTVREIGKAVELSSTSTVHGHLSRLEENGYIKRDPSSPRAIEITVQGLDVLDKNPQNDMIPILGTVTAGEPITAIEDAEDFFPLPDELKNRDKVFFMLNIRGDSMIEAGILDGDYVIVQQQASAYNGDIVIAMTDDNEATCKKFYKEEDYIRLQPENKTMDPIILDDVSILGKVVSLYRPSLY
jgi:repressor LexA